MLEKLQGYYSVELYSEIEYKRFADKTDNVYAKSLYTKLAEDERRHQGILKDIAAFYHPDWRDILVEVKPSTPIQPEKLTITSEVQEAYHAMKFHLKLEFLAVTEYRKTAQETREPKLRDLWLNLASDEERHHREINSLLQAFEKAYKEIIK
jgi:rubrerythrin